MVSHFDTKKLQQIIKSFYHVSGIQVAVYNDRFELITRYPEGARTPLCELMRTSSPLFDKRCEQSDRDACRRCKSERRGFQYQCHIGLSETVVPIICENVIVGYLLSGQLIPYGHREGAFPDILRRCRAYGMDEQRIYQAYEQHPEIEPGRLDAAFEILQACTAYLWMTRAASVEAESLVHRIDEYIQRNLQDDLSVTSLCEALDINKSRLNRISRDFFGDSIQRHIRKIRIEESKRLLKTTDLSISDVAASVGIADYNYFTKVFRSFENASPREYRKRYFLDKDKA